MMFYLLLVLTLTNAMNKKPFYNPVQVYYKSTSIPASSHAIVMDPKSNPKQNIVNYSHKINKSLPDYNIPKWVYEKVFRHNKPNYYKFDEE